MKRKMRATFIAFVPDEKGVKRKRTGEIVLFTDSTEFATIADAARDAARQMDSELKGVPIDIREYRHAA